MRRGKERWTHLDDERLSQALLAVFASHREVMLSDNCALWKRVHKRYHELVLAEPAAVPDITVALRSARSLHTRWARGIRPDMILFASLVDKLQKAGKKPLKAIEQAEKLFKEERSEINATIMRRFVRDRQQPIITPSDLEAYVVHPKLKFESFHFRHCYEILRSNRRFLEVLLGQDGDHKVGTLHKRRRVSGTNATDEIEDSFLTSSDNSDTFDFHNNKEHKAIMQVTTEPYQTNNLERPTLPHSKWQVAANNISTQVRTPASPLNVASHGSSSVVVSFDDNGEYSQISRLECDRDIANEFIRIRTKKLEDDRRLKLIAELRGVVETIAKLAKQLAWTGVASTTLAAKTGLICSVLDEDVLRDIAFFRAEKKRLQQSIAALDSDIIRSS
ncbi:uncharacterized protein PHALS_03313 [Plasmopara halstedii]|uniref:Uncharacterized protein n=1 Tax=Plasmopara halstedii TaxID=4781 RepID=A0A0P1A7M5_PLAHL|nr:uncharacterized protein PHALS_03313 [Plasmopara halstedii]CEG36641.1 hypothetical protein PHALS_03313 [Plasmopara halstedii]|eukprot:XP_024573010.1 hypothetical protein PHALS_03313 [Plasmopara halstedii]